MAVVVKEVFTQSAKYEELFSTATALGQAKYISAAFKYALESVLLGAFEEQECLGFIRFLIQVLGAGEG